MKEQLSMDDFNMKNNLGIFFELLNKAGELQLESMEAIKEAQEAYMNYLKELQENNRSFAQNQDHKELIKQFWQKTRDFSSEVMENFKKHGSKTWEQFQPKAKA